MFSKSVGNLKNQSGVVFPYLLLLLLLMCLLVENKVRQYVSYRNFIVETESKLVVEHLLYMASHDPAHYENIQPGMKGKWDYPGGEVYFGVESITHGKAQMLIIASSHMGGKAQAQFGYDMIEKKIISWSER
ncbi:competence type IV pilus minor pilin ComGG [Peribacillus alkalitolerans]|uniref:competence type IV pilus minor pilin ComGG n=1 Tax=Peribacillus alkalitolerans TaxID=1550385 RepID=UPI0013D1EC44|nr:competence type IV pilus minor pilin ComGG [Peribacillus alkalitolerans]